MAGQLLSLSTSGKPLKFPLSPTQARGFASRHAQAVVAQGVSGLPVTLPVWTAAVAAASMLTRRGPRVPQVAAAAGAAQAAWVSGYALFSFTRTYRRVRRASNDGPRVYGWELVTARGPVTVSVSVKDGPSFRYIDAVFASPRGRGGGAAVVRWVCEQADRDGCAVALNTVSPSVGRFYRSFGFNNVCSI